MTSTSHIAGYDAYLQELHSKEGVSAELISSCVSRASNSEPIAWRRIAQGEANEVYDVRLKDGSEVIVRIALHGKKFEGEKWAVEKCSEFGLPVPEILSIETLESDNSTQTVWIQRKIQGAPWSDVKPGNQKALAQRCGEILRAIHSIETEGFGYVDHAGVGQFATRAEEACDYQALEERLIDAAESHGLDKNLSMQTLNYVTDNIASQVDSPRLIHNDYEPKHIILHEGVVAGVIDFGEAASGDPMNDLVRFSLYPSEEDLFGSLLAGYGDHDFDRMMLYRLGFNLFAIVGCHWKGVVSGVQDAHKRLQEDRERAGF